MPCHLCTLFASNTAFQPKGLRAYSSAVRNKSMIYIPAHRLIPVVPDVENLPTTIRLPRDRRLAVVVLVVSGVWMMIGAFSAVWMPLIWPQMNLVSQVLVTFLITAIALTGGIAALRRYASQDEVTISLTGIAIRRFTWLGSRRSNWPWQKISTIEHKVINDKIVLFARPSDPGATLVPVCIAPDEHRARRVRQKMLDLLAEFQH